VIRGKALDVPEMLVILPSVVGLAQEKRGDLWW